ncbi:MAG: hypothetical protein RR051_01675, partial [Clostridiales bacterium]
VDVERQEQDLSPTEAVEPGPEERTSREDAADGTAQEEAQESQEEVQEESQEEVLQQPAPAEFWQRQYTEVQGAMTRKAQELAAERQKRRQLEAALSQVSNADPAQREQFLQNFLTNPQAALRQVASQTVEEVARDKVKEILTPIIEANQHSLRETAWSEAWAKTADTWGDVGSTGDTLVRTLVDSSQEAGDQDLMFRQPDRMMKLAALELFGMPKEVDQEALRAATRAAREDTLRELSEKNAGKSGLAAAQQTRQMAAGTVSEEEKILEGIMAAGNSRIF